MCLPIKSTKAFKVYIDSGATLIRVKSYQLVLSLIRSKVKRTVHRRCSSVLFIGTLHRYCSSVLFIGINPKSWIFAINEYFLLLNTPAEQRLRIVGFNLEGAAAEWFRWMSQNGLITTWDRFEESVKNRFGPSKYEDPQGALSKLLQLGTMEEY
ncbi:ty3-gypsy retrotransposon protein [Tanacetum coccineum]